MAIEDFKKLGEFKELVNGISAKELKDTFTYYVGAHLGKSKYGISKSVDEVFLQSGDDRQRGVLKSYEEEDIEESMRSTDELRDAEYKSQLIFIFRDYIKSLNLKREEGRMLLSTFLITYLTKPLRNDYPQLNLPKEYDTLSGNVVKSLDLFYNKILAELKSAMDSVELGEKLELNKSSKYLARTYLQDSDGTWLHERTDSPTEDMIQLYNFDLTIFTQRVESVDYKEMFGVSSSNHKEAKRVFKYFRSVFSSFVPEVNINILVEVMPISDSTYNKYKSRVSNGLLKFAGNFDYESVINYLTK
jgi:hypothetical protein